MHKGRSFENCAAKCIIITRESFMSEDTARRRTKVVVLALGNDILGDDAVGFLAARAIRPRYEHVVDFVETGEAGLALVELLEGYDKALILDAAVTGNHPPGMVLEYTADNFSRVVAPSPHYAGLPEVLDLARRLGLDFPRIIRVLAMEVEDPYSVREELSPAVSAALPSFIQRAQQVLDGFLRATKEESTPVAPH
jgi:hydrogenase maturation protease